ncbi:MAG: hypothetical protein R2764_01985 [Bacteroidales bacterium]
MKNQLKDLLIRFYNSNDINDSYSRQKTTNERNQKYIAPGNNPGYENKNAFEN